MGVGPTLLAAGFLIEFLAFQLKKFCILPFKISFTFQVVSTIFLVILLISGLIWFNLTLKLIQVNFRGKKKKLIVKGPFAFVRHPLYAVISITLPPLFVIWQQDFIFVFTWFFIIILVHLVVKTEEKGLLQDFGNSYQKYKKYVPAILPFKGASGARHFNDIIG